MGYLCNVKKQYWISFFYALIPAYVIERLFWQQRGMNVQMVIYCEIIYALTVILLEIPSGILADRFGRKRMLSLNGILSATEMLLLLFARHFWQFALAVFLAGIGKALSSGSEKALLYDSLAVAGEQDHFEKRMGRLSAVDFTGSLIAALCGGVLANYFCFEFNYALSVVSMLIAFSITLTLREPPFLTRPESELTGMRQYAKQSLRLFGREPLVLLYCLTGAVTGACLIYLDEFWQLIMEDVGVPVLFFGAIGAAGMLFRIPANLLAYRLKEKFRYEIILTCLVSVSAVGYTAVFLTRNAFCLIPMIGVTVVGGIAEPLISGYLHHHTESHIRATVESFSSLGLRVISIPIGLLFGYISTAHSIFAGFAVLGGICLAYLVFLRSIRRSDKIFKSR